MRRPRSPISFCYDGKRGLLGAFMRQLRQDRADAVRADTILGGDLGLCQAAVVVYPYTNSFMKMQRGAVHYRRRSRLEDQVCHKISSAMDVTRLAVRKVLAGVPNRISSLSRALRSLSIRAACI
ncbi:hypothetical protein LIHA111178_08025 [Litorimonas haliclonae]